MPKRSGKTTRSKDVNQVAAMVVQVATSETPKAEKQKDPLAVELGRRGGLKGGKARAESLSPQKRRAIARKAAQVRWASHLGDVTRSRS